MKKAIVFDFGGVMTTTTMPERARELTEKLGIDWAIIKTGFDKYRRQYDGGFITGEEMYAKIWKDGGIDVSEEATAAIVKADGESWLYRNEKTLEYMKELKRDGHKIGILTNMPPDFISRFKECFADFIAVADAMVISGEEHTYKPNRDIYDLLQKRIGVPAGDLIFIDDVEMNIQGARDAGWLAVRFESNEQVARDVKELCREC